MCNLQNFIFKQNFRLHSLLFFELFPEVFLLATAHGVSLVMHGTIAALLSVAPLPSVATQLNPNLSALQMIPGSFTPWRSSLILLTSSIQMFPPTCIPVDHLHHAFPSHHVFHWLLHSCLTWAKSYILEIDG